MSLKKGIRLYMILKQIWGIEATVDRYESEKENKAFISDVN